MFSPPIFLAFLNQEPLHHCWHRHFHHIRRYLTLLTWLFSTDFPALLRSHPIFPALLSYFDCDCVCCLFLIATSIFISPSFSPCTHMCVCVCACGFFSHFRDFITFTFYDLFAEIAYFPFSQKNEEEEKQEWKLAFGGGADCYYCWCHCIAALSATFLIFCSPLCSFVRFPFIRHNCFWPGKIQSTFCF